MGYVAVTAGEELIERAEQLFEKQATSGDEPAIDPAQVEGQLGRVVGQTMSEAGLYAPRLAALALTQSQGDTVEAAFLLRAYRSTLERYDETAPIDPAELIAARRVSPAFKDVPGGQLLGATKDYTQRLLDFEADPDDAADPTADWDLDPETLPERLPQVADLLREEGLLPDPDPMEGEPTDATRESITHPADRDAVLQELARGETGAVTALGYSALRGYGQVHPTLAEVRVGDLPVRIEHPYTGEPATVCHTEITESQAVLPVYEQRDPPAFGVGYGLTFGRNERKAIGMTILDASIQLDSTAAPAEDPEFVLDTVDGMDSFGFIEHLKLPHYVTFQSILDRIRSIRERGTIDDGEASAAADRAEEASAGETAPGADSEDSDDEPDPAAPEVSDDD